MKLINDLFKKYKLEEEKLIEYGFVFNDGIYSYNKLINNNEFELIITIKNKMIDGKLIDKDFNEEYEMINSLSTSSFIEKLKKECEVILLDIRSNCYFKENFIFDQSNEISNYIKEKYNANPEYLWNSEPGFGVFRNPNSNKWFGIIMNIKRNKITGNDNKEIEVLNLMLKDKTEYYLNNKNIYPAYHMSKKNWVSIILDESLSNDEIIKLIDLSYSNSNKK
jgi:predicted DNA-binding protein (MmcQ/YjbR family)